MLARIANAARLYAANPRLVRRRVMDRLRPERRSLKQVKYLGMDLVVLSNEDVGWSIVGHGEFERSEITALRGLVRPDDLCIDAGANIGVYTVCFSRWAPRGRVHAFEPVPLNGAILALNVALNDCSNVEIHSCALGESLGVADFSFSSDGAFSSLRSTGRKPEASTGKVELKTVDSLYAEKGIKVDVMKVDVEGAEEQVIRGAARLLSTPELRPHTIMLELCATNQLAYNTSPEKIVALLATHGYEPYSLTKDGMQRGWPRLGAADDVIFRQSQSQK